MKNAYKGKNKGIEKTITKYYDVNIKTYKLLEKVACKFFYLSPFTVDVTAFFFQMQLF